MLLFDTLLTLRRRCGARRALLATLLDPEKFGQARLERQIAPVGGLALRRLLHGQMRYRRRPTRHFRRAASARGRSRTILFRLDRRQQFGNRRF